MRYLCLIYDEEAKMNAVRKSEGDALMKEYGAFTEGIRKSGKYVAGEALHPVSAATTIRVRNGKTSTTDGPFAETKEQLGGFYLIDATVVHGDVSGGAAEIELAAVQGHRSGVRRGEDARDPTAVLDDRAAATDRLQDSRGGGHAVERQSLTIDVRRAEDLHGTGRCPGL